jgi:hypothetical protein
MPSQDIIACWECGWGIRGFELFNLRNQKRCDEADIASRRVGRAGLHRELGDSWVWEPLPQ